MVQRQKGLYFTDIFKSDKRLLVDGINPANGKEFTKTVNENLHVFKEHIDIFKEELDFIGAEKPLLIIFGNDANDQIEKAIKHKYLDEGRFFKIEKISHYSQTYAPKGGDEAYLREISEKLSKWIKIPTNLKDIRKKLGRENDPVK